MDVKPIIGSKRGVSPLTQMREGVGYIWHNDVVRTLIGLVAVSNLFAFGYSTLMPAFADSVLNVGASGLGLLSAAVGVGALGGALLVASLGDFRHKGMLLTFGNLFFPVMVLLFSFSRNFALSMLLLVGVGLGFMIQNATTNTLVQITVPDALRGRVMSVYMMVFQGFFPIGSLMAGFIAQNFGISIGAAVGGAIALAYGLFLLWRAPLIRRLA
jgi:predicted MFS family arabinose efflux permease